MGINVIRWKLNELMARNRIRNKDLAEALGITENSIYRLRRIDEMPRLSPERLNGLCEALSCQPGELLEWVPDSNGDQGASSQPKKPEGQGQRKKVGNRLSSSHQQAHSWLSSPLGTLEPA